MAHVQPANASLLLAYALPYVVFVAVSNLPEDWLAAEPAYALRGAAALATALFFFRRYVPLRGPGSLAGSIGAGAGAGVAGTALWAALMWPFADPDARPWSEAIFGLRLLVASTVVPLIEELLFRGYLLRLVVQWDQARQAGSSDAFGDAFERGRVGEVEPGAWTPLAIGVSSVAFAAGHAPPQYLAAVAYGALMSGLWVARKDLVSCVIAHGVTNAALAVLVYRTGLWGLW